MKALNVPAAGEQPVVSDLPVPEVAEGTVLVRVKAAGLNPADNHLVARMMAAWLPHEYPLTLGRDAAGVVEAVGPGVTQVRVGDEVVGTVPLATPGMVPRHQSILFVGPSWSTKKASITCVVPLPAPNDPSGLVPSVV